MITFMMNKRTGNFDIIGPVADLVEGTDVPVTTKSGAIKSVICGKVGKPFTAKFGAHEGEQVAIASLDRSGKSNEA